MAGKREEIIKNCGSPSSRRNWSARCQILERHRIGCQKETGASNWVSIFEISPSVVDRELGVAGLDVRVRRQKDQGHDGVPEDGRGLCPALGHGETELPTVRGWVGGGVCRGLPDAILTDAAPLTAWRVASQRLGELPWRPVPRTLSSALEPSLPPETRNPPALEVVGALANGGGGHPFSNSSSSLVQHNLLSHLSRPNRSLTHLHWRQQQAEADAALWQPLECLRRRT
jgi:hypothetical protein